MINIINQMLNVFWAIVKFSKQSRVIIRLRITHLGQSLHMNKIIDFIISSSGKLVRLKGGITCKPLMCNGTKSMNKYGLEMEISKVFKIYYYFLLQRRVMVI